MILITEVFCSDFSTETLRNFLGPFVRLKKKVALFDFHFMITEFPFEASGTKHCSFLFPLRQGDNKIPLPHALSQLSVLAHIVRSYLNGVRSFSTAREIRSSLPLGGKSNVSHAHNVLFFR